ncbi:flagellar basal body-associated protein FliL [Halobacillus halophilus]|uniref:flagellar basal body-associated protein FliL n=1 Tax=Halobacillus halophilus TaxID=1570 RepID=UPI001CD4C26F|nr:flagellar basal body-associated protein FliL [Halobacillus halophilus]MCA1009242.1 flagellar basal body-associated protein FliL [Halobacillus halophilus]
MTIKNRVFKTMIIILSTLTLLGAATLIIVMNLNGTDEVKGKRSIDEMRESSMLTEDITTDLKNGDFVRIRFRVVTDSKKSLEELQKRDFQMQNILIKELAVMDSESFQSGLGDLEDQLKEKLNEVMSQGTVTDVYTVDKVLQ